MTDRNPELRRLEYRLAEWLAVKSPPWMLNAADQIIPKLEAAIAAMKETPHD